MNSNQPQGPGNGGQQPNPQQTGTFLFRPEQMRNLPEAFSAEDKQKWEHGLMVLYKTMEKHPPDSQAHQEAKKKVQDFSNTLKTKIRHARVQASQGQSRPPNQGTASQSQGEGAAPNQNAAQPQPPRPSQSQPKPSEQMLHHINTFPYVLPSQFTAGTPEATKWLQDAKNRYCKALMTMENTTAQLRNLENMAKDRSEQGKPLSESEQKEYTAKKEMYQKGYADAKRFTDNFRKQQEQQNELLSQQKGGNGTTAPLRPTVNLPQQAPSSAQQNTEAVNAAIQSARTQQMQSGRPNGQSTQQSEQILQAPSGQSVNVPSNLNNPQGPGTQSVNIKAEGGASQPQVNTAIATAPHIQQTNLPRQQNSPLSAVPQSTTSTGPPRALTHPAALELASRTYSSTQTSATPNVMGAASHAHPSIPRETSNVIKMPIPKQLPPNAIAPPQPVPMQPSRPTISGGPSNAGNGLMGQPVLQKTPGFNLEGEGERVMNKRKLDELVRQVTGGGEGLDSGEGLTPEVEDCVLSVADEFVDQVITAACKCAKARGSKTLEIRDIQLILERNYNIRIPGYASDEIRTVRKFQPAQGWIAKMSAIQAAKVTGSKGDL